MPLINLPCHCATLRQAARAITALYDRHLEATGLRGTQFTILQTLHFQPGARNVDMVEWLGIDQTTITRTLDILRRRTLVQVVDRPSGREKAWALTALGATTLAEAMPAWERAQRTVQEQLGSERLRKLHHESYHLAAALPSP